MKEHKKVLVFARHPSGGIRTYFRYVYGQHCMTELEFSFLVPSSAAMSSIVGIHSNRHNYIASRDSSLGLLLTLFRVLFSNRFDLIHSHGFTAGIIAAVPAKIFGLPHIITTHDVFNEGQFKGLKGSIKRWLIGKFLALGTVINPVGTDARENFLSTYPYLDKSGKVIAIRNGIDSAAFLTNERRDLRNEAGLPPDTTLLGFFGRFMAQKGFATLVDAVDKWNAAQPVKKRLHVACFGWGGFIREEKADIRARKLDSFFHFFPATDEMVTALRGVDAVVMPSRWEACPLLPMEAFVAGVPLLATDCIGLREVTIDCPVTEFCIGDSESLLRAINQFVENKQDKALEAIAFRKVAAERFDVATTSLRLRALFDQKIK